MTPKSDLDRAIEVVERRLCVIAQKKAGMARRVGKSMWYAAEQEAEIILADLRALKEESKG